MQTISPAIGVAGANSYYRDEYKIDEDQSVIAQTNKKPSDSGKNLSSSSGRWRGELSKDFGLEGAVERDEFRKLTEGQHPKTGEQLVRQVKPRPKKNKDGEIVKDKSDKPKMTSPRRAGNDLTLSAPKSISIAAIVGNDERIAVVHRKAVDKTFDEIEKFVEARMGNIKPTERTGKCVWAIFSHELARPDEKNNFAAPDLHDHGFLFNSTKTKDGRYRAIQPYELFCSQQFATAVYRSELAVGLKEIGYEIRVDEKTNAPEIVGISREYIEASSPRQREVKAKAQKLGSSSTKKIAHLSRQKKTFDREEMQKRHFILDEKFGFQAQKVVAKAKADSAEMQRQNLTNSVGKDITIQNAKKAVDHAICEAKKTPELNNWRTIITTALNQKMSETTFDEVKNEIEIQNKNGVFKNFNLEKKISRSARKQHINGVAGREEVFDARLKLESFILPNEKNSKITVPQQSLETTNYQSIEKTKEVKNERITGRTSTKQHQKTSAERPTTTSARSKGPERETDLGNYSDDGAKVTVQSSNFYGHDDQYPLDHEKFVNETIGNRIIGNPTKNGIDKDQHRDAEYRVGIISKTGQPTNDELSKINNEQSTFTQRNTADQFSATKSKPNLPTAITKSNTYQSGESDPADWQQSITDESEYAGSQRRGSEVGSKNGYNSGIQKQEDSTTISAPRDANQISGAGKSKTTSEGSRQNNQTRKTAEKTSNGFAAKRQKLEKTKLDSFRQEGISELSNRHGIAQNIRSDLSGLYRETIESRPIGVGTSSQDRGNEPAKSNDLQLQEKGGRDQRSEELEQSFKNSDLNNMARPSSFDGLEYSSVNFDDNDFLPGTDKIAENNLVLSSSNLDFISNNQLTDGRLRNIFTEPILQPAQNIVSSPSEGITPVPLQFSDLDSSVQQQFQYIENFRDFTNNDNFDTSATISKMDSLNISKITSLEPLDEKEKEYIQKQVEVNLNDAEREEQEEARILEESKKHEEFKERVVLSI